MAQVQPYHTVAAIAPSQAWVVYHDDDACADGRSIPLDQRKPGTGFRTRCPRCLMLQLRRPHSRRDGAARDLAAK